MRPHLLLSVVALSVSGCGLELIFENLGHSQNDRPASKVTGVIAPNSVVTVLDPDLKPVRPFQPDFDEALGGTFFDGGTYELRLPSSTYANLTVRAVTGNVVRWALLPSVGEESGVTVDVDDRNTAETLITVARLSAEDGGWKKVTPAVYADGTRKLIRAAFDVPGPTQDLLREVERLTAGAGDPAASTQAFFRLPVLRPDYTVSTSPIDGTWLAAHPFDYVGDGTARTTTAAFDAKLAEVARLYKPAGCIDRVNIRVMFTVDFNAGRLNGNCGSSDRFKWAVDKPGKQMFFVGWVHKESPIQDPAVNKILGASTPNQLAMHDDGQAGDEVSGDNVWTIYFDVPRGVRIGYKYTWGSRGSVWTGSEEWPGNSRIIQADDLNGDDFVYRRDVFGDEATNKDVMNLNTQGHGAVTWDTVLRPGWGLEAREQKVDLNQDCVPDVWVTPTSVGPLTSACTQ